MVQRFGRRGRGDRFFGPYLQLHLFQCSLVLISANSRRSVRKPDQGDTEILKKMIEDLQNQPHCKALEALHQMVFGSKSEKIGQEDRRQMFLKVLYKAIKKPPRRMAQNRIAGVGLEPTTSGL